MRLGTKQGMRKGEIRNELLPLERRSLVELTATALCSALYSLKYVVYTATIQDSDFGTVFAISGFKRT